MITIMKMMTMMMLITTIMMMIMLMMMMIPPGSSEHAKDGADEQVSPEGEGGVVADSLLNVNISGTSC